MGNPSDRETLFFCRFFGEGTAVKAERSGKNLSFRVIFHEHNTIWTNEKALV